ncbi:homoserine O-succinyltransferase [Lactococcus chungangensis]|jgi:homoserine O-succinyltransferase|nr:homoserine O-succinyltransferase [Lactococcus chungangensis]MDD3015417.1 homoserine O-succinyltransferase [Lactococcus chungangensis]NCB81339.1 homoserine O-succinyltransferase [Bacilli bacterium]SFZ73267.1 homoserine O-succinyltransferase [Lactococcus chungangensis CAU 28 = DSM 22330]
MPVKVNSQLPAVKILEADNIFVMDEARAAQQDIRTLKILVVNLMPRKMVTETQLLALLSNTPLQINVDFLHMMTHQSKNITQNHLDTFYKCFNDIKSDYYDGMIVTGAPVENLDFEAVDYWDELHQVLDWSRTHVYSTLHICWGAQAGLYARYGIPKHPLAQKLWGVYHQTVENPKHVLFRGFDDDFVAPHSRSTETYASELPHDFEILSYGETSGLSLVVKKNLREIYSFGHLEYDRMTLDFEYQRDKAEFGEDIVPDAYYPNDDPTQKPKMTWSSAASLFFSNWLNYAVYQDTPYDLRELAKYEYFNL